MSVICFGECMKKNVIKTVISFIFFAFSFSPVFAAVSVEVEALSDFNSLYPVQKMKVMSMEKVEFENGIVFENGTIIEGDVIEVKQPKRAKLNASFKFQPTSYTYNGKTVKILDSEFVGKYKEKKDLNKGELALSAATTAGGFFLKIPLLSQGVSLVKGMVQNPEDNRFKSGVVQVYKDSPLSYVEEGKDIIIKKQDIFYLKFKTHEAEDLDAPPNNVTPVEEKEISNTTPPDANSESKSIEQTQPDESQPAEKVENLKSPHPDEVLREVELNSAK